MPDNPEPRAIADLTDAECRNIIDQIRQILWFDFVTNEWNLDNEWDMETLECISGVLEDHGLRPTEKEPK
jgi:hypothetical protein